MSRGSHQLKIDLTDEQHQEISAAAKKAGHTMAAEVRLRLSQHTSLEKVCTAAEDTRAMVEQLLSRADAAYATYPAHQSKPHLADIADLSHRRKKA